MIGNSKPVSQFQSKFYRPFLGKICSRCKCARAKCNWEILQREVSITIAYGSFKHSNDMNLIR